MKNQNINTEQDYKYGFTTDIESIRAPKGCLLYTSDAADE